MVPAWHPRTRLTTPPPPRQRKSRETVIFNSSHPSTADRPGPVPGLLGSQRPRFNLPDLTNGPAHDRSYRSQCIRGASNRRLNSNLVLSPAPEIEVWKLAGSGHPHRIATKSAQPPLLPFRLEQAICHSWRICCRDRPSRPANKPSPKMSQVRVFVHFFGVGSEYCDGP